MSWFWGKSKSEKLEEENSDDEEHYYDYDGEESSDDDVSGSRAYKGATPATPSTGNGAGTTESRNWLLPEGYAERGVKGRKTSRPQTSPVIEKTSRTSSSKSRKSKRSSSKRKTSSVKMEGESVPSATKSSRVSGIGIRSPTSRQKTRGLSDKKTMVNPEMLREMDPKRDAQTKPFQLSLVKVEMLKDQLDKIVDIVKETVWTMSDFSDAEIAKSIKYRLDFLYEPIWFVVVGTDVGVCASYHIDHFAQFMLDGKEFIIFRSL